MKSAAWVIAASLYGLGLLLVLGILHSDRLATLDAQKQAEVLRNENARLNTRLATQHEPASPQARSVIAILDAADKYGMDSRTLELLQVAYAESRWNPNARNPKSGAMGLAQFMPETWHSVKWRMNKPYMNPFSPEDSADALVWCYAHHMETHWVTSREYQLAVKH